jgi:hypothetical protein
MTPPQRELTFTAPRPNTRLMKLLLLAGMLTFSVACGGGDDDDRSSSPTSPTPTGRAAVIVIENFVATASPPAGGVVTYTVSLRLRETAGVAATLTGVTLTLTTTTGGTISRDYAPTDAFGTNRIAANGSLTSSTFTLAGPPVMASSLAARVAFTDDNGNAGTAQGSTLVR